MISKRSKSKCVIENVDIHLKKLLKDPEFKEAYEKERKELNKKSKKRTAGSKSKNVK